MEKQLLTCLLDEFRKFYLPFIPAEHGVQHESSESLLVRKHMLAFDNNEYRWGFTKENETDVARVQEDVIEQHRCYSFESLTGLESPHLEYIGCPNTLVMLENLGANFRIDGCFNYKTSLV
jgi:hypothetical protein